LDRVVERVHRVLCEDQNFAEIPLHPPDRFCTVVTEVPVRTVEKEAQRDAYTGQAWVADLREHRAGPGLHVEPDVRFNLFQNLRVSVVGSHEPAAGVVTASTAARVTVPEGERAKGADECFRVVHGYC